MFFHFRTGGSYPGAFQRRSFNNEDITVTLPDGVDACDIGTITVWCQPFRAIFTRLAIPRSTFVSIHNYVNVNIIMIIIANTYYTMSCSHLGVAWKQAYMCVDAVKS